LTLEDIDIPELGGWQGLVYLDFYDFCIKFISPHEFPFEIEAFIALMRRLAVLDGVEAAWPVV
jgi:hypothetical protein